MNNLPDFSQFCEATCIKLWGEPAKRTKKELRWENGDAYGVRTYTINKRAWYDHGAERGGSTLELIAYSKGLPNEKLRGRAFIEMWKALVELGVGIDPPPSPKLKWPILATYPYPDENNVLLFEVVRFDTTPKDAFEELREAWRRERREGTDERFRQRQPDGKGDWIWNTKGVRRVLYRLPQLIEAVKAEQLVLVTEGEKDANTAVKLGYAATTMPGGVGKWRNEYDEFFRDADVVIVSDNDPQLKDPKTGKPQVHPDGRPMLPGQDHAAKLAKRLSKVAKRVRVIMFEVKDLSEWVEKAGGTREQLDEIIAKATEPEPAGDDEIEKEIERLAALPFPSVEYDRECKAVAKKLGVRLSTLEDLVAKKKTPTPPPGEQEYMKSFSDIACNVGNVLLALKQESMLMNAFGYDEMLRTEMLLRPLFDKEPNFKPRPVTDADITATQSWLQWIGFRGLGKDATHDAVNKHARDHAFHPVRDYLNGLHWDDKTRLRTWLYDYLGTEGNAYTNEIGKMFLIGMVARIFKPGCKFDYMPILEGDQGLYKSKACAILAGEEYFSDQLPDIKSKEASQHLRGKWLVEVAELSTYSRAKVDDFKAFLTRQVERYRPPWGRKEVHEPRQCAFIGTTNKVHYFRDETGNRRFWPTTTGVFKLDELCHDRDQLFAEAVKLYRDHVHWWPDRDFELKHIAPEQESRYEPDVWEPLIKEHLDGLIDQALKATPSYLPRTTMIDIAIQVLGFTTNKTVMEGELATPINRLEPKVQTRIRIVLSHLGWVPKRDMYERWWEPGPKALTRGGMTR
jgi:hypothetical protein